jgi:hypothetical protein
MVSYSLNDDSPVDGFFSTKAVASMPTGRYLLEMGSFGFLSARPDPGPTDRESGPSPTGLKILRSESDPVRSPKLSGSPRLSESPSLSKSPRLSKIPKLSESPRLFEV